MKNFFKQIIVVILVVSPGIVSATCLKVDGLEFEAINDDTFLVSRTGKNLATMSVDTPKGGSSYRYYGARKAKTFRFFTDVICDHGAERQISINGTLQRIYKIDVFK